MMKECPKCGFLQPADRYCANCGIDMPNFKPRVIPWHEKLLKNTGFQILAAAGIVFFLAVVFYSQTPNEVFEDLQQPITEEPARKLEQPAAVAQQRPAPKTAPQPPPAKTTKAAKPKQDLAKAQTQAVQSLVPTKKTSVKILFTEAPASLVSQWNQRGRTLAGGAIMVPTMGDVNGLKTSDLVYIDLGSSVTTKVGDSKPLQKDWSYESDEGESFGLQLQVSTKPAEEGMVNIEVTMTVRLKSLDDGNPIEYVYSETIENNHTLILTGILPKQSIPEEELEKLSDSPLSVLASQEFIDGVSDFVLVLHPK